MPFISFAPTVLNEIAQSEALGKKPNSPSPAKGEMHSEVSNLTILSYTRSTGGRVFLPDALKGKCRTKMSTLLYETLPPIRVYPRNPR
ncbi:MAG: hypothetical protein QM496_17400 [Verrucomicrobiota bacterium]